MIDITKKPIQKRMAKAQGEIHLKPETIILIKEGKTKKGDPLELSKYVAMSAAKNTANLLPHCHPLPIESIQIDHKLNQDNIQLTAEIKTEWKTGVEMEAMVAVAVAALTIYDMVKAVDRTAVIGEVKLMTKKGGRSGSYVRGKE